VPPDWYKPYEGDNRGIPAMSAFGEGYRHHVTGLVHDELGFPTEKPNEILSFQQRLTQKITWGFPEIMMTKGYLLEDAEIFIIAYGSVARSAMRAVDEARQQGIRAGLLQLLTLFPFPRNQVTLALKQCRAVLVPEMNMGQISREVQRVNQEYCTVVKHNRVDGQFITPDELLARLVKL
jgi:2-oxoglutarate ferredoxin oxidoreductase subunit alpha